MYNEAYLVKVTALADVADIGNSRKTVRVVFHEKSYCSCSKSNMAAPRDKRRRFSVKYAPATRAAGLT